MTYKYERIDYRVDDWTVETETHKESTIFQTPAWLEFLSKTQDGEIIVRVCRRCIRKAEKKGVIIEEAQDLRFSTEYFAQLTDVFAKQNLVPTYGIERVQRSLHMCIPQDSFSCFGLTIARDGVSLRGFFPI